MEIIGQARNVELQMAIGPVARVVFISVVIPIAAGIGLHKLAPAFSERVAKPLTIISGIGILVGIVVVWIAAAPAMWSLIGNGTVIALAAFVVVGLVIGHLLGGPTPENRTSLALSTASRHPGIALLLAGANFPAEKLVTAAVLLYLIVNAVVSVPYLGFAVVRAKGRVGLMLEQTGLKQRIGEENFFPTLETAVAADLGSRDGVASGEANHVRIKSAR